MKSNLAKMIGKRIVQSCITILLVTLFVFALIQLVPGDPVVNYLGSSATEEQITYYRHLYGFDKPVIVQYFDWITGLFRGTMGQSISYQSEIADILLPRLAVTLSMVIPAFIIGTLSGILLGIIAAFMRLTRSSMLEVMRQDYVTPARAKGVPKRAVTLKHQLRNSLIPIVTSMGSRLGSMVGSTVLIESLFVIPGLGSVMMNGISNRDFMLVANGVLIISIFVALCNLVVDILYGIIDPRTR